MNKSVYFLLCCLLYFTSCSDTPASSGSQARNTSLAALFERYYQDNIALFPLEATANGDNRFNDKLYIDFTDSYRGKIKTHLERYRKELAGFRREDLNAKDRINYDCLDYELKRRLEGLNFHSNYMPLEQIGGFHLTFAQMGSGALIQPFNTVQDYDNWLQRMKAFGPYVDSVIVYFRKGMAAHYVLPKALVAKMIPQMKDMVAVDPKLSVFYQPILKLPGEITSPEQARLGNAYRGAIATIINPAYQKLGAFLQNEYLPAARSSSGIWDVPDGKAYYDYAVRANTSTRMSAEEIYNLGLSEVKRIRTLMDSIKTATGFSGDLKTFFSYLATDKRFMPFHNADEILAAYENIHTRMKPQLRKLFLHEPRTPFEIRQIEAYRVKSGSSQYFQGSPDGKRPGIFYVLILDPTKYNVVEEQMESLFLHEAIPGHHYQISLQQEDTTLPAFRRFSTGDNAYIEGWALYCESLGKELGLYTDPYQYLGALGAEMHRAIRLVVDAGLHARHMTREEAIQYMTDNEQISQEAATIEIERYMAWPGQALGYKVGSLTIKRLREECAAKLGAKFNIAAFHDEVLKNGSMPLDILEQQVKEWAAQKN
ncbi:DUF885 domain-containing protein [Taibaiella koreensis]|uniref:DUF885 domain-containing protein n=1 Tax=Taibaiella koreensis TaxID=1268548 RepID=UPI000E59DCE9|nr:DUF885 domain-containing protein [Taibaiella koreensis]